MTPDGLYDKEVEEGDVYTFACQFLTEEKGHKPLDFLDSAGLPRNYAMPSWVPDWSVITQKRPSPLLYWQLPTKKHNAIVIINAPGKARPPNGTTFSIREEVLLQARMRKVSSTDTVVTLPSIHEPPEKPLLLAKGRIVGSIDSVITSHSTLEPLHKDGAHQTPHDRPAYPNGDLSDVLWKTLVLDRDLADGVKAPENWGDIFYHCISHPPSPSQPSVLQRWWTKCKHFKLCGSTLEEIALARKPSLPPLYSAEELARLQSAFILGVGYRKLATTESGYLCLVPLDAEAGDIVAILIDCSAPVLLRRQENKADGYEFIGTCYVHGIMHGEAVDQLQDEDAFPEEFDIR
jgi:hypothetical protein